jgi:site-specific recombinase XerD
MNAIESIDRLTQTLHKIDGAYAYSTIRAFRADFEGFIRFCEMNQLEPFPAIPETVANFISHLSNLNYSSSYIRRIVASLSTVHKLNRFKDPVQDPEVKLAMRRMHRLIGRFAHQVKPINKEVLHQMIHASNQSLQGLRDRALLSVAYDTLCRRSEIVSLLIDDIRIDEETGTGRILLRRSKTDQEAIGKWLPLRSETVHAIQNWMSEANIKEGLLFRGVTRYSKLTRKLGSGQVGRIYKRIAKSIHLDDDLVTHISGHSMRIGAAQDLMKSGASLPEIMVRGRWKKVDTVMRYIEETQIKI